MTIPRRTFLRYATAGASAPAWLAAAFAQEPDRRSRDEREPSPLVQDALARARRRGLPLLFIVVPEEEDDEDAPLLRERMKFWGRLLHNASSAGLLDLALCEFAAARRSDLVRTLEPDSVPPGAPLAYLIEPDGSAPTAVDPELPALPSMPFGYPPAAPEVSTFGTAVRRRIDAFEVAFREHLLPDAGSLAERARTAEACRAPEQPPSFAALRLALERATAPAPEALEALAAQARARVRGGDAPQGAAWGVYEPCGVRIDGHSSRSPGVGCGMGFVPSIASRFLLFYVAEQDG